MSTVSFNHRVLPDQLHQPSPQLVNPQHSSYETDKQKFDRKFQELSESYSPFFYDSKNEEAFRELQFMQTNPSEEDVRALFKLGCEINVLTDDTDLIRRKSTKQEFIEHFKNKGIDPNPPFILVELVQALGNLIPTFNLGNGSNQSRAKITFHRDFVTDYVNDGRDIRNRRNEAYKRSLY